MARDVNLGRLSLRCYFRHLVLTSPGVCFDFKFSIVFWTGYSGSDAHRPKENGVPGKTVWRSTTARFLSQVHRLRNYRQNPSRHGFPLLYTVLRYLRLLFGTSEKPHTRDGGERCSGLFEIAIQKQFTRKIVA